jgi:hypothetical protein
MLDCSWIDSYTAIAVYTEYENKRDGKKRTNGGRRNEIMMRCNKWITAYVSLIVSASRLMNWSAVGPEEQIAEFCVDSFAYNEKLLLGRDSSPKLTPSPNQTGPCESRLAKVSTKFRGSS